ncbi:hypothetical protein RB195_023680 [Necator americanus]|uniref:Uncharacterized protein n=1 Tax=Necator americanus TaxID=51031 RepID=A0ABR1EME6_NECAM
MFFNEKKTALPLRLTLIDKACSFGFTNTSSRSRNDVYTSGTTPSNYLMKKCIWVRFWQRAVQLDLFAISR